MFRCTIRDLLWLMVVAMEAQGPIILSGETMVIREEIGRFIALRENGTTVTIAVMQDFHTDGSMPTALHRVAGRKSLETDYGEDVSYLEHGSFQIVQTGEMLTSDDPRMPSFD